MDEFYRVHNYKEDEIKLIFPFKSGKLEEHLDAESHKLLAPFNTDNVVDNAI